MTIYNLEYRLQDSKGRTMKPKHVGVFASLEAVENVKKQILADNAPKQVTFNIYPVENIFEKLPKT